jgi:hypothetical protein
VVKRPGRDSKQLGPSSWAIKNEWNYTASPAICLHGVYMDSFTFLPLLCIKIRISLFSFL